MKDLTLDQLLQIREDYLMWELDGSIGECLLREYTEEVYGDSNVAQMISVAFMCNQQLVTYLLNTYMPIVPSVSNMDSYCAENPGALECRVYDC